MAEQSSTGYYLYHGRKTGRQHRPGLEQVQSRAHPYRLRHDPKCKAFNPSFRQLLHVGFKIAARKGDLDRRTEGAGVIFHAGLAGQTRHQMRWNEVAKLAQQSELAGRWLVDFIFHALPCGKAQTRKPTFFYTSTLNPVGQQ